MKSYALFITTLILISFTIFYKQKVEIIYFFNKGCLISNITDDFIKDIEKNMGNSVYVVYVDGFNPRSNFEVELIEKYSINSVPVVIIDGNIFDGEFTYQDLKDGICRKFIFKPKGCFK